MKCNCIENLEQRILEKFRAENPNKDYDDINSFEQTGLLNKAFSFEDDGGVFTYSEIAIRSTFTKVNGEQSKAKRELINVNHPFCPFCGVAK